MNKLFLVFACILFFTPFELLAQNQDTLMVRIEMKDGNEFIGSVQNEDDTKIVLKTTTLGVITIQKSDIRHKEVVESGSLKDGKVWFANPQSTRYFWAPNSYGLKKGEGYYQNIYVFWNQFTYGLTDNFSVGAGVIPLFLLGGGPTPVFITAKFSIPVEKNKFNVGGGAIAGTVLGEDLDGAIGILYGLTTYGTPDNNLSISLGYGFGGGELVSSPLINVSGLFRISSRFYFLTENYYLNLDNEGGVLLGLGGRWIIKRASLDFMLGIPVSPDMGTFIALPAIGFTIPFGKN